MNEAELKANKQLTRSYVKDLNKGPNFEELSDNSTDVVICNVSVDYLVQPIPIFREIHRSVSLKLFCDLQMKKELTMLIEYSNPTVQRIWHSAIGVSLLRLSENGLG